MKSNIVFGVGINDANYKVTTTAEGKMKYCVFYSRWRGMLRRCYDEKQLQKSPTYRGCTVAPEWHSFMNFRSWMLEQDWEGDKQLDKDLLIEGNKIYSPDTCIFVSCQVNNFLTDSNASRGALPIGVSWGKQQGKYKVHCQDLGKGNKFLGLYDSVEDASEAYTQYKRKLAIYLASIQENKRIADALTRRYA